MVKVLKQVENSKQYDKKVELQKIKILKMLKEGKGVIDNVGNKDWPRKSMVRTQLLEFIPYMVITDYISFGYIAPYYL